MRKTGIKSKYHMDEGDNIKRITPMTNGQAKEKGLYSTTVCIFTAWKSAAWSESFHENGAPSDRRFDCPTKSRKAPFF